MSPLKSKKKLKSGEGEKENCKKPEDGDISNMFKTLNYQKLKHIDRLLGQMSDNITYGMEKKLSGDTQQSLIKKVFNNYSVDDYFDSMMAESIVRETLKKIEDS